MERKGLHRHLRRSIFWIASKMSNSNRQLLRYHPRHDSQNVKPKSAMKFGKLADDFDLIPENRMLCLY